MVLREGIEPFAFSTCQNDGHQALHESVAIEHLAIIPAEWCYCHRGFSNTLHQVSLRVIMSRYSYVP
jgi:hypothetical protein